MKQVKRVGRLTAERLAGQIAAFLAAVGMTTDAAYALASLAAWAIIAAIEIGVQMAKQEEE